VAHNDSAVTALGRRLRELRLKRRLGLNDLARLAGLSRSTLYKVENSGMSLTYEKLIRLSEGLGVEISELFRGADEDQQQVITGRREVGRGLQGDLVSTPNYDHYYLCNEIVHKGLVPILGRVKSRSLQEFGPLTAHPGEEFTYVLEGAIEVHTKLYRPVRLNQGDHIYLDSTMPHAFVVTSKQDALILTVCTRPEHRVMEMAGTSVSNPNDVGGRESHGWPVDRAQSPRAKRRAGADR
jgi:transcriptional regulator with XRE-family HTH domain